MPPDARSRRPCVHSLAVALADRLGTTPRTQELKGSIRVFCRVRPPLPDTEQAIVVGDQETSLKLTHGTEEYPFKFDKIFPPKSSQERVFEEVEGLVQSALDGYKVCIFAYGQSGTGKTFTMQGTKDQQQWGLIPSSLT